MDILIVSIGFRPNTGGLETHLTDLTNELKKRFKVLVVTLPPLVTRVKAKTIEKEKNLTIWRVPWFGKGLFYKFMDKLVLQFFYLVPPMFSGTLTALIRHPEIKVIHAQGLTGILISGLLGKLFGKRVVVSTHYIYNFEDNFFARFTKFVYSLADMVLCVSIPSKEEMLELGIAKEKIGRCAYWLDVNKFKRVKNAKKSLGWEGFSAFFVGRLVKEKGIFELIDSAKYFKKGITLYIVGDGPQREEVEKKVEGKSNIKFLGRIENTKLPKYYSAADAVVLPSYEETLGRVNMEALSCGTPVLASDTGGVREVVDENVGILFDEVTPKKIANAVNKLYGSKSLQKKFAKNARPHIKKHYSPKNVEVFIKEYGLQ